MPQPTPFHPHLAPLNQTGLWRHWSGYLTAPQYQHSVTAECYAIRSSVSVMDASPLFKYRITGADARAVLERALVRDVGACGVGRAQYTSWCDGRGFVVQDGVVMQPAPGEYRLTSAEPALRTFREVARGMGRSEARIEDVSRRCGILALQGPHAHDVLGRLTDAAARLAYFGVTEARVAGSDVLISRTGYTGDLGYELWIGSEDAGAVFGALMDAGRDYGLIPIGTTALKMARIEAGLLLMGADFHSSRFAWTDAQRETPLELGWGWMLRGLAEDGRDFVGRSAIEAELARGGGRWRTVGLAVDPDDYERVHEEAGVLPPLHEVYSEATRSVYRRGGPEWDYAGYASSFTTSSLLKKPLAIAKLPLDLAEPGSEVDLEVTPVRRPVNVLARVERMPFFDPGRRTGAVKAVPVEGTRAEGDVMRRSEVVVRSAGAEESARYDAIVIGGGHNGLVHAAYLAKAGLRTLVLERRNIVGGAAITEELLPGFHFTTFSYALSLVRPRIVQDLELVRHGMMVLPLTSIFQPGLDGEYLLLGADADANYHEIARLSVEDAEAARDLDHRIRRLCRALRPWMDRVAPDPLSSDEAEMAAVAGLREWAAGLDPEVRDTLKMFRTSSAAEIVERYFEHDLVKAMYAASGIIGSDVSVRDRRSGLVWLFLKMGEYDGVPGEWGFHKGGNGAFTQVLARAVESFGGEIRTGAGVSRVRCDGGRATGVELEDGSVLEAGVVVSALDPRQTFLKLVDPGDLPVDLIRHIEAFKFQGSAAKVNFALSGVPTFPGLEGREDVFRGFVNVGPSIAYLEEAFEDARAGRWSRRPFIDCCVQSLVDPDMAPPGKHVMSCFVMYAPYELADSDWDSERENLGDTVQATLESFFPGFGELVLHREVVTPLDIERVVGLSEGNIYAGELFEEQLFVNRPAPGWSQYRTPIDGYYQCGSGCHPGGGVSGGPGWLASTVVIGDLGLAGDG